MAIVESRQFLLTSNGDGLKNQIESLQFFTRATFDPFNPLCLLGELVVVEVVVVAFVVVVVGVVAGK